jgi:hypothetical protein
MTTLNTQRNMRIPVSIPHRSVNMATHNSHHETTAATLFFKQEHQRMIKDPRSISETKSHKPMWYFLLSRTGQAAAMRKIAALYKTTPGLTWEEKWVITEAALRESRMEQMAGISEAVLHMRRFLVYDGDIPLPDLFAGCITDEDRLNALLARPSPSARMALETFSRRTTSGQSMTSSSDNQDIMVNMQKPSGKDGDKVEEFEEATRGADLEDGNQDGYESEDTDEIDEEDRIWEGLVKSCILNYGTFC